MHPLICKTLGCPSSPWPPDWYTLLGLPTDANDTEIETAVLARMEKLRVYQITHPEPVTEAMNLLAQALIVLSDPNARAEYDFSRSQNIVAVTPTPLLPPTLPTEPQLTISEKPKELEPATYPFLGEGSWRSPDDPAYLDLAPLPAPPPIAHRPVRSPTNDELRLPSEWQPTENIRVEQPVITPDVKEHKRLQVRWLVRLRKLLRAWDVAGEFFSQPRLVFADRAQAVAIIAALRQIAVDAGHIIAEAGPGRFILNQSRTNATVTGLTELSLEERSRLASDWRAGRSEILGAYWAARRLVGRHDSAVQFSRRIRRLKSWSPAIAFTFTAWIAFLIALARSAH